MPQSYNIPCRVLLLGSLKLSLSLFLSSDSGDLLPGNLPLLLLKLLPDLLLLSGAFLLLLLSGNPQLFLLRDLLIEELPLLLRDLLLLFGACLLSLLSEELPFLLRVLLLFLLEDPILSLLEELVLVFDD